jgi:hypothetical protein
MQEQAKPPNEGEEREAGVRQEREGASGLSKDFPGGETMEVRAGGPTT